MLSSRPFRAALRLLAVGGLGLTGVALLAGCGSGGGEGTATLPPGASAGAGAGTLPADVAITRPPGEDPVEAPVVEDPVEQPVIEDPVEAPVAEDPVEAPPVEGSVVDVTLEDTAADDEVVWWPWVLGLLVIVGAVVALVASRSRRGSSEWTTSALSAIDASDALSSHLLAMAPEGLVVVARDDAQRLAELDVATQDLVRTAPDGRTRGVIDAVRGPLVQLHAAVDMVSLSPAPTPDQLALVQQWANALHVATSTGRSTLTTPSS